MTIFLRYNNSSIFSILILILSLGSNIALRGKMNIEVNSNTSISLAKLLSDVI